MSVPYALKYGPSTRSCTVDAFQHNTCSRSIGSLDMTSSSPVACLVSQGNFCLALHPELGILQLVQFCHACGCIRMTTLRAMTPWAPGLSTQKHTRNFYRIAVLVTHHHLVLRTRQDSKTAPKPVMLKVLRARCYLQSLWGCTLLPGKNVQDICYMLALNSSVNWLVFPKLPGTVPQLEHKRG